MVVVDRLTKYGHFLALSHPFSFLTIAQKQDLHLGAQLRHSTTYHPQTNSLTEVVNKCLEGYMRCMSSERPTDWVLWMPLAEWWYNTTYHTAVQCTPYDALYGQKIPHHMSYLVGSSLVATVDRSLQHREVARAQERMRQMADRKRFDREFKMGDFVYLKLQPYRQHSLREGGNQKMAPRYFGPYPVAGKFGKVAYKLTLPEDSRIHPTFHVSKLKKHIGAAPSSTILPPIDVDGNLRKIPIRVLEMRVVKRGNQATTEVLVGWANPFPKDATWENLVDLKKKYALFDP
ncbi:reverse transcriptase [Gossypium australe]|uniref:Reverse transcriptase n=1 Tax=Gossypium australe TaxID=47621 RepID=A0A5B6V802_9ROSI|nr:reverse transcriptase [Gossypium australe]